MASNHCPKHLSLDHLLRRRNNVKYVCSTLNIPVLKFSIFLSKIIPHERAKANHYCSTKENHLCGKLFCFINMKQIDQFRLIKLLNRMIQICVVLFSGKRHRWGGNSDASVESTRRKCRRRRQPNQRHQD
jgi:hypothetical protein